MASLVSGTVRGLPFFVSASVTVPIARATFAQVMLSSSLRLMPVWIASKMVGSKTPPHRPCARSTMLVNSESVSRRSLARTGLGLVTRVTGFC